MKNGFYNCNCKCCGSILSLVRFLFSFVNINRIAKFPLPKNTDLVTQSFMSSHDNVKKQIIVKFHITDICACSHTLKGRWIEYLVYLRIKQNCLYSFGLIVFNY